MSSAGSPSTTRWLFRTLTAHSAGGRESFPTLLCSQMYSHGVGLTSVPLLQPTRTRGVGDTILHSSAGFQEGKEISPKDSRSRGGQCKGSSNSDRSVPSLCTCPTTLLIPQYGSVSTSNPFPMCLHAGVSREPDQEVLTSEPCEELYRGVLEACFPKRSLPRNVNSCLMRHASSLNLF